MLSRIRQIFSLPVLADEGEASVRSSKFTIRYAALGVFFGLTFPVMATGILILTRAMPVALASALELQRTEPLLWIITLVPVVLGVFAAVAGHREDRLRQAYTRLQQEKQGMAALQQLTGQLERRTTQLNTVAKISRYFSTILNLQDLLNEVVNQIKDKFGYYHAHIYLLQETEPASATQEERQAGIPVLVVAAGTGAAGAEMQAKGHKIALNAASLVARAARSAEIVAVDNVSEAIDWLPNPLLPDTISEMAVPIVLEGEVIGVLDVQQDKLGGLDEGDAGLLQSLANQVAITIRNIRLLKRVENDLVKARELQRRYIEQTWDRTRITRQNTGRVQFSLGESSTLDEKNVAAARRKALDCPEPVVVAFNDYDGDEPSISPDYQAIVAPIRLQSTSIGNLQLHEVGSNRSWTADDMAIISAVADQVAQTAENLRLLDTIQERASREQLISQISAKLRRAPDIETLAKIGVSELSRVLNPARTFVRLGPGVMPASPRNDPANGSSREAVSNTPADSVEDT